MPTFEFSRWDGTEEFTPQSADSVFDQLGQYLLDYGDEVLPMLERLEDEDREILLMRHFEQLTNSEAAELLGLSQPAAGMRHLRAEGMNVHDASEKTAVARLRPVLMTALVAGFGFLPMALSTTPGSEIQRPLATVVIGGLVTSLLLTTLVLPTIYPWFCPRK